MKTWWDIRAMHWAGCSATLAALAVLAGCGGGGGGGDETAAAVDPPPAPAAQITSAMLEASAMPVLATAADIDDSGRLTLLFAQEAGGRIAVQAVQGDPGPAGALPVFSQPLVVDTLAPHDGSGALGLAVSPAGHALAIWQGKAPCTVDSYNTAGLCSQVYTARRLVGSQWEPPVRVGDTPGPLARGIINDAGDVALLWSAWRRDPASGALGLRSSVVWKSAAGSQFTAPVVFDDIQPPAGTEASLALDRQGNMVYASLSPGPTGNAVVARRGNLTAGFGQTERLDILSGSASLEGLWAGINGHVVLLWQQADGGQVQRWSAALDGAGQAWQVSSRGAPANNLRAGSVRAVVSNTGDFIRYDLENCRVLQRSSGTWQPEATLPAGLCVQSDNYVHAMSRTGDLVGGLVHPGAPAGNTGQWLAYDAAARVVRQPQGASNLLGTPSTLGGTWLLSENGVAALVSTNPYDTLPSASAPTGLLGQADNLWVVYLKLP